jgi:predicted SAM-dependent methyltransferase
VLDRLHWGCGPLPAPGWTNSDRIAAPGVDLCCDIRDGLPVDGNRFDYAVGIHALQDVPYLDVRPVLRELRRVLKPGGVLRLSVPDLERSIAAWQRGDPGYFYIPDDEVTSIGGKLIVQATWYGSVRTPFSYDFLAELALGTGFQRVTRCAFGHTGSPYPEIVSLDNRERESLFVEAVK